MRSGYTSALLLLITALFITWVESHGQDINREINNARKGYALSQYRLGFLYENGIQTKPDNNEAVWWYRHAAEQGLTEAMVSLAHCYADGVGVERDFDKALTWYLKAAEQGDSVAQNRVGEIFRDIIQDYDRATTWFLRSAEHDYAPAMNNLGKCYREGFGLPQSHPSAVAWFKKASEKSHPEAVYNMAYAYQMGEGVAPNLHNARAYYNHALMLGYQPAAQALDQMQYTVSGRISGLVKGDTLIFRRVDIPHGIADHGTKAFEVVPDKNGTFSYSSWHRHPYFYTVSRTAKGDSASQSEVLTIFIDHGKCHIEGDAKSLNQAAVTTEVESSQQFQLAKCISDVYDLPIDTLRGVLGSIDSIAARSYYGKQLARHISDLENVSAGCSAPMFAFADPASGKSVSSTDIKGHPVLIYYWEASPEIAGIDRCVVELAKSHPSLTVVGLTPEKSKAKHPWHDYTLTPDNAEAAKVLHLGPSPHFILISPDGTIAARSTRIEQIIAKCDGGADRNQ